MKTYSISDIHGHYENLQRFMDTLQKDDRVYVLGDIADKGKEPIRCFLTIMNDKRMSMILGNHEYMMYQYFDSLEGSLIRMLLEEDWVKNNFGSDTLKDLENYSDEKRGEILDYIENLPLNIPDLEVNGRHFYLVHSNPVSKKQVTMKDLDFNDERISEYVWERRTPFDKPYSKDITVIAGHTIVQNYTYDYSNAIKPIGNVENLSDSSYIDIDGGLAYNLENSKLIVLCLDDMTYQLY